MRASVHCSLLTRIVGVGGLVSWVQRRGFCVGVYLFFPHGVLRPLMRGYAEPAPLHMRSCRAPACASASTVALDLQQDSFGGTCRRGCSRVCDLGASVAPITLVRGATTRRPIQLTTWSHHSTSHTYPLPSSVIVKLMELPKNVPSPKGMDLPLNVPPLHSLCR